VCEFVSECVCVRECVSVFMSVCVSVCVFTCVFMSECVHVCVCVTFRGLLTSAPVPFTEPDQSVTP